jgi:hypothetical protein
VTGAGGATAGTTGAAGAAAGTTGTGGGNAGRGGSAGGAAGQTGSAGRGGNAGGGGSAGPGACPPGAIFCTDFEIASGPPAGSTVQAPDEGSVFGTYLSLDAAQHVSGAKALKVTSPGAFNYRMLGVAVPATFWVRLHMRSDQDIGLADHNAFLVAMTNPNYHNSTTSIEFSEQYGCLQLNEHDTTYPAADASGKSCGGPPLAKNTWHCVEAMFDGANGNVQIFTNGTKIVDAISWARARGTLNTFEFGFAAYHGPGRSVWYDDVAIATTRVGCP